MNIRFCYSTLLIAGLLVACTASVQAQDLLLQVDRATGDMTLTGASATIVDLAGYGIFSNAVPDDPDDPNDPIIGTLVPVNFNGLRDEGTIAETWVLGGGPPGNPPENPSARALTELIEDEDPTVVTPIDNTVSFGLGAVYDPTAVIQAVGFGVDIEQGDLTFQYVDPIAGEINDGVVEYLGEKIFNTIGITVDLSDGSAILENESPFNQTITGYLIEATTDDTLNTNAATFDGVGGAFQNSPGPLDGENLGQTDSTGVGLALNAGASVNLGIVGGLLDDLSMSFVLQGSGQEIMNGFVKYIGDGLTGDYNGNGVVDAADYTVWRDNLGGDASALAAGSRDEANAGPIGEADYDSWKANFGNTAGAGSLTAGANAAVPEPASAMMVAMALISFGVLRRRD